MPKSNAYEKIYDLVRKIPKGKVTTYGIIGKKLNISPRFVGHALHLNSYKGDVPCHRVVDRNGRVASNFAFGGKDAQRQLLETEGVRFINNFQVQMQYLIFPLEF